MQKCMGNKKPHNRVGIICAVYVLHIIINSTKSQDIILKIAEIRGFYTVISSP